MDIHEFTAKQPVKRMASGALIYDITGRILLVKPTYRPKWLIPGGMVEYNESPLSACHREIQEELALCRPIECLLIVDYAQESDEGTEAMHFIFDGGSIDDEQIKKIKLCDTELSEYQFVAVNELVDYLPNALGQRVLKALAYLNNGTAGYSETKSK